MKAFSREDLTHIIEENFERLGENWFLDEETESWIKIN